MLRRTAKTVFRTKLRTPAASALCWGSHQQVCHHCIFHPTQALARGCHTTKTSRPARMMNMPRVLARSTTSRRHTHTGSCRQLHTRTRSRKHQCGQSRILQNHDLLCFRKESVFLGLSAVKTVTTTTTKLPPQNDCPPPYPAPTSSHHLTRTVTIGPFHHR